MSITDDNSNVPEYTRIIPRTNWEILSIKIPYAVPSGFQTELISLNVLLRKITGTRIIDNIKISLSTSVCDVTMITARKYTIIPSKVNVELEKNAVLPELSPLAISLTAQYEIIGSNNIGKMNSPLISPHVP